MTDPIDPEGNETRTIHELVDFSDKDVLEIGCGDGRLIWRYADKVASVVGLDPFERDIEQARWTSSVRRSSCAASPAPMSSYAMRTFCTIAPYQDGSCQRGCKFGLILRDHGVD